MFLLVAGVVAADQMTKHWIMTVFRPGEHLPVIPGFFDLVYVTNTGAAFGFLAGDHALWRQGFFITVALVALAAIITFYRHNKSRGILFHIGLGLIGGGAIGNLIDRLRWGAVVDFLDFYVGGHHWPAFNVADSAITTGVALFLLANLRRNEKCDE